MNTEQRNAEHWWNSKTPGTVVEQRNTHNINGTPTEHQRNTTEQRDHIKQRTIVLFFKEI